MKILQLNKQFIAPLAEMSGAQPEMILARQRLGLFDQSDMPAGAVPMDVQAFLDAARALKGEINAQLVNMDDAVTLVVLGLLTGENVFMVSLPGAAKSTLAQMVASGVMGKFFRVLLNPDLTRNDLIGSLDPAAIKEGKWQRRLAGLATAGVALVDEFFKGSGAIRNMTLDALEEHRISTPDGDVNIPLLMGCAASNELVDPTSKNAAWDRFLFRMELNYPTSERDWMALLGAGSGRIPIQTSLDPEEVILVQAMIELDAHNCPDEIKDAIVKTIVSLGKKGFAVSPRRAKGWVRAVMAYARLMDEAPHVRHLIIGQHILWTAPEDIKDVRDLVAGISDPERGMLLAAAADLEAIAQKVAQAANLGDISKLTAQTVKATKILDKITNPAYADKVKELTEKCQGVRNDLLDKATTLQAEAS